jgi:hypothetical protein
MRALIFRVRVIMSMQMSFLTGLSHELRNEKEGE